MKGDALNKTNRPILFNICEWGELDPWEWAAKYGNSWRSGPDHHDTWNVNGFTVPSYTTFVL